MIIERFPTFAKQSKNLHNVLDGLHLFLCTQSSLPQYHLQCCPCSVFTSGNLNRGRTMEPLVLPDENWRREFTCNLP